MTEAAIPALGGLFISVGSKFVEKYLQEQAEGLNKGWTDDTKIVEKWMAFPQHNISRTRHKDVITSAK